MPESRFGLGDIVPEPAGEYGGVSSPELQDETSGSSDPIIKIFATNIQVRIIEHYGTARKN